MHKVMIKRCNEKPFIEEVKEVNLEYMQSVVDGLIEIPYLSEGLYDLGIDIVINEEGKLNGSEPNMILMNDKRDVVDILMGDILFTSSDEEGRSIGLNEEQINALNKMFDKNNAVTNVGVLSYILTGDKLSWI